MKYLIMKLLLFCFVLNSCLPKSEKKSNCLEKVYYFADKISQKNDISFSYNKNCHIDSLFMKFKLDKRSFEELDNYILKNIVIEAGYIDKGTSNFISQKVTDNFNFSEKNRIVNISASILNQKIDSINYLSIQTIGIQNSKSILSNIYTYKNSLSLIKMQNTYLDYKAFIKTNTQFKNISKSKSKIDSILITVKPSKNIDDITKYKIILNDTLILNFRNSIRANYRNRKTKDKNIVMYNLLKNNRHFTSFKLNLSRLNLYNLNSIKASLE